MGANEEMALLREAAAPTLALIRDDRRRASRQLKPLLQAIEEHLLEYGFGVRKMMAVAGVRDHSLKMRFHSELGCPPRDYLRDAKLVVASNLVVETELSLPTIAHLTGFLDQRALAGAFRRWSGQGLATFRRLARERGLRAGAAPVFHPIDLARRAMSGQLDAEEAVALTGFLEAAYGVVAEPRPGQPMRVAFDRDLAAGAVDEMVWRAVREQPFETQRATLRKTATTPVLFHRLRRMSREVGRRDRRRGVELAELALASLEGCVPRPGESLEDLEARGWAWVGRARWRADDLRGAEEAFACAETVWSTARGRQDLVRAETLHFKAALRLFQHCYDEALALETEAIMLLRPLERPALLAQALVGRAQIVAYAEAEGSAVRDLEEALELLEPLDQPHTELAAQTALTYVHLNAKDKELAARPLARARALCFQGANPLAQYQVQWLDGLFERSCGNLAGAERRLRDAQRGIRRFGSINHLALVSLDLAMVHAEAGRSAAVAQEASKVLALLESLEDPPEVVTALRLLRAALTADRGIVEKLAKARELLARVQLDPARCRAPKHQNEDRAGARSSRAD